MAVPTTGATTTTRGAVATRAVRIYLVRGETLAVTRRTIAADAPPATAALDALLRGPVTSDGGMITAIPAGTRAHGVSIVGGTATADLTRTFESGGGSLSMRNRIAEVVYTLTQFPTVQRVAFRIDGTPVTAIGGEGLIVDPPRTRADFTDALPNILVETPTVGSLVVPPLVVQGMSDVFEAVVQFRVRDAHGAELVHQRAMATAGTGTWGTFSTTLRFSPTTTTGTLEVYAISMKDGSEIDKQIVPLTFFVRS